MQRVDAAIPAAWASAGFDHIGDIDVAGHHAVRPVRAAGRRPRITRRWPATTPATLAFRDAKVVQQHENAFVAVDGASGIAYSMDRSGGDELLRYDIRAGWRPLAPLPLDRTLEKVQGGAVGARRGVAGDRTTTTTASTASTSTPVRSPRSAPRTPADGEGGGIDAAELSAGDLHVTVDGRRPGRR